MPKDAPQHRIVFVFGALRSGTTVFRLMLDGHPRIKNPGEVDFLLDYLVPDKSHASGWRYDLGKLAENRVFLNSGLRLIEGKDGLELLAEFLDQYEARGSGVLTLNIHRNIGKVLQVLPAARIIHMLRDPRDVARSSIGMGWSGTLYSGINHWITTEAEWEAVSHALSGDRVHVLKYENLFRDIEAELRAVCGFLEVDFEPEMLEYHRNSTYDPPDASLVEQWRSRSTADDIALVEGKAGPLMASHGYVQAGEGRTPSGAEHLWLLAKNRVLVWRTGVRRYGFLTYFLEKLARYCGMEKLHRRLRNRMRDRSASFVK
ncbi:sulfotransferase [Roseovarius sp. CAU 1744]|uniref:sulfotransferase family protein n=1 Tax=Roseovarius sp. CAU 1744 TaxID=3140368 RepID=UPI00325B4E6A